MIKKKKISFIYRNSNLVSILFFIGTFTFFNMLLPADPQKVVSAQVKHFGYDFFDVKEEEAEILEGTVNPNYIIGPKDEIIIDIWGDLNFSYALTVSNDGYITIPNVDRIYLNGITFSLAENKIIQKFGNVYSSSINVENPGAGSSIIKISLGKVRSINILVAGEVKNPGVITIKNTAATVLNVLRKAKGITEKGSLRNINIKKSNGETISFDFYDVLLKGEVSRSFEYLQDGDFLYILLKGKEITIKGEIRRPAIYELSDRENLYDLVNLAGVFTKNAYLKRVQIIRTEINRGNRIIDFPILDGNPKNLKEIELEDGDQVLIFPNFAVKKEEKVTIEGEGIRRPGTYQLENNMTVEDLIKKADGLFPDALLERADLIRTNDDFTTYFSTFDLKKVLEGDNEANFELKQLDKIRIYSEYTIKGGEKKIIVTGHVKDPGTHILHKDMTLYDLMFSVGGFNDPDFRKETYLERAHIIRFDEETQEKEVIPLNLRKLLDKDPKENSILLKSLDEIRIYFYSEMELKKFVYILGEVKKSGRYELRENMNLRDLISLAGGLNDYAYLDKIEITNIINTNEDSSKIKYISLNSKDTYLLNDQDYVFVRKKPDYGITKIVKIEGEVEFPGEYTITEENERISSIIEKTGGLKYNAFIEGIEFYRIKDGSKERVSIDFEKALLNKGSYWDFILMNGDYIYVPPLDYSISISGEVEVPGRTQYIEGKKLNFYVELAGGYKETALKEKTQIILPNGTILPGEKRFWFDPKVPFGSKIYVPGKEDINKLIVERIDDLTKVIQLTKDIESVEEKSELDRKLEEILELLKEKEEIKK